MSQVRLRAESIERKGESIMQKAKGRAEKRGKPKITKRREVSNSYTSSHKKRQILGP